MTQFSTLIWTTAMALLTTNLAQADKKAPVWSYAKLTAKADVIAVVEVKETRDARKRTIEDQILKDFGVEILTQMKPLAILKGPTKTPQVLVMRHCRLKPRLALSNGPRFMKLRKNRRYLVFLKKRKDGHFQPVSGQFISFHSAKLMEE